MGRSRKRVIEWAVVLPVLAGMCVAELGLRRYQEALSGDVAHFAEMESIAERTVGGEGLRVLVWGNSTLSQGVDPVRLEAGLEDFLGKPVTVGMIYPDGTVSLEWSYLLRRLVFLPERIPDALVLVFGHGNLRDRPPERSLLRLAAHHVAWADVPQLFREDLPGFEDRASFLVAKASVTYGLRDRIAPRVFDLLIRDYRENAPILLQAQSQPDESRGRAPTFEYLQRILADCSMRDLPLFAALAPHGFAYELEPQASTLLREAGVAVLDARSAVPLSQEFFRDPYHLNAEGRELFTDALIPALGEALHIPLSGRSDRASRLIGERG
jgi:hypothetical protein